VQTVAQKSKALESLKADIFIGDTETDHEAALLANVEFVAVASGQRCRKYLAAKGCSRVVESMLSTNIV
jgi:phosphoglycolate phosphatase-like HAD superfamily hydrolase